jgi:DNA-binding response OmpR family regulator
MPKIMLVEDDLSLAGNVRKWLEQDYEVAHFSDGSAAACELKDSKYDLIILDWELPGTDGPSILRGFRQAGGRTPVLMLTGRSKIADKEHGYDSGTDDYLTKPFDLRELSARIRAILKRAVPQKSTTVYGNVVLNHVSHDVTVGGTRIDLQRREFALLEFLLTHQGQIFNLEALMARVWSADPNATRSAANTCISRVRKKLQDCGAADVIETVHGVGYRVKAL